MKADKILVLPIDRKDFLDTWLQFTEPFHKLTNSERKLLVVIIVKRFRLMESIKDEQLLNTTLFSYKAKEEITEELGISYSNYSMVLNKLKKKGAICSNGIRKGCYINPKLIPEFPEEGQSDYKLLFCFKFKK